MKCHGVSTVCLTIDFRQVSETFEVRSADPSSSEVAQSVLRNLGDFVMQRWTQVWMKVSRSPGSALILAYVRKGKAPTMLIGSMEIQKPVSIELEQVELLKSVIGRSEA